MLVSVPHYGTQPLPHITRDDYGEPSFETFAYGFADTFVGELYGDLHEHGATVLATPSCRRSTIPTTRPWSTCSPSSAMPTGARSSSMATPAARAG